MEAGNYSYPILWSTTTRCFQGNGFILIGRGTFLLEKTMKTSVLLLKLTVLRN